MAEPPDDLESGRIGIRIKGSGGAEVAERIKLAMGKENAHAFAKRAGLGYSLMRQYLEGSVPGLDKAAQIARSTMEYAENGVQFVIELDHHSRAHLGCRNHFGEKLLRRTSTYGRCLL